VQYCCVYFLESTDPMYITVGQHRLAACAPACDFDLTAPPLAGSMFVEEYRSYFGPVSHIYNADQFNEVCGGSVSSVHQPRVPRADGPIFEQFRLPGQRVRGSGRLERADRLACRGKAQYLSLSTGDPDVSASARATLVSL
jgi:hypothetical protein